MLLEKRTGHLRSISLSHEEFQLAQEGRYDEGVRISSLSGKPLASLTKGMLDRRLRHARLLLVDDDPDKKHYWVVNL